MAVPNGTSSGSAWLFGNSSATPVGAGAAGGFATARRDVSNSLPGVAVSLTLVPALATAGLLFQTGWSLNSVKIIMIFVLLVFTGPTATHALAKSALHGGLKPKHLEDP